MDREGCSGGLALFWNKSLNCNIVNYSIHFVNMTVDDGITGQWRLSGFYGLIDRSRRQDSWKLLQSLFGLSSLPWCVFCDFNDIISSDKCGTVDHPAWFMRGFRDVVPDCNLMDLVMARFLD